MKGRANTNPQKMDSPSVLVIAQGGMPVQGMCCFGRGPRAPLRVLPRFCNRRPPTKSAQQRGHGNWFSKHTRCTTDSFIEISPRMWPTAFISSAGSSRVFYEYFSCLTESPCLVQKATRQINQQHEMKCHRGNKALPEFEPQLQKPNSSLQRNNGLKQVLARIW